MRYYSLVITFILFAVSLQAQDIIRFDLNGSEKFKFESDAIGQSRIVLQNNLNNFAVGTSALNSNTTGSNNIANGYQSLYLNTSGHDNVALGYESLYSNGNGYNNVAMGKESLYFSTSGHNNIALGYQSLYLNSSGNHNIATGYQSLNRNATGAHNIANGYSSLFTNWSGSYNIAQGTFALHKNFTGTHNIAFGYRSLYSNTHGIENLAIGHDALYNNTEGQNNIALGNRAQRANITGYNNIAIGNDAITNIKGSNNVAIGNEAGLAAVGHRNVFLGSKAGRNETSSDKLYINNNDGGSSIALIYGDFSTDDLRFNAEVGIGRASVGFPLTIEAGSDGDIMKIYDDAGTAHWHMKLDADGNLGYTETDVANNRLQLKKGGEFNVNGLFKLYPDGDGWMAGGLDENSDRRLKKNIVKINSALVGIKQLAGYRYNWIAKHRSQDRKIGVIAQEVQAIYPELVSQDEEGILSVNYSGLAPILIEAVKEQQTIIESQEARIVKMEQDKIAADTRMAKMEAALESLLLTNNLSSSIVKK